MRASGEIESTFEFAGNNGAYNSGFMVMTLAPWDQRSRTQQQIMAEIGDLAKQVPSLRVFPIQPNSLGIRGAGNGLQFALVGNNRQALGEAADRIIEAMKQDPASRTSASASIRPSRNSASPSTGSERPTSASTSPGLPTPSRRCSTATTSPTSTSPTAATG